MTFLGCAPLPTHALRRGGPAHAGGGGRACAWPWELASPQTGGGCFGGLVFTRVGGGCVRRCAPGCPSVGCSPRVLRGARGQRGVTHSPTTGTSAQRRERPGWVPAGSAPPSQGWVGGQGSCSGAANPRAPEGGGGRALRSPLREGAVCCSSLACGVPGEAPSPFLRTLSPGKVAACLSPENARICSGSRSRRSLPASDCPCRVPFILFFSGPSPVRGGDPLCWAASLLTGGFLVLGIPWEEAQRFRERGQSFRPSPGLLPFYSLPLLS